MRSGTTDVRVPDSRSRQHLCEPPGRIDRAARDPRPTDSTALTDGQWALRAHRRDHSTGMYGLADSDVRGPSVSGSEIVDPPQHPGSPTWRPAPGSLIHRNDCGRALFCLAAGLIPVRLPTSRRTPRPTPRKLWLPADPLEATGTKSPDISGVRPVFLASQQPSKAVTGAQKLAERVGFEPTCRNYPTIRFRVGAVMTTSVPLRGSPCGGWYSS